MPLLRLLIFALVAGYVMVFAVAWLLGERLIFPAPPSSYAELSELFFVETDDGVRIAALHLPLDSAAFTILYSHGNGEDLGHIRAKLEHLRRLGFAVVAYDYRGYGLSGDRPTVAGTYRDIDAVYRYVTGELGVPPRRVILYGSSVGSGPSVHLGATEAVAGLILEGAFTTAFRVVTRVALLPFDHYRNVDLIRDMHEPVLVMHGTGDRVVPFGSGRALYEAAPGPKRHLWVEGAPHNGFWQVAGERFDAALLDFRQLLESGE